jgi:hypothetical protein
MNFLIANFSAKRVCQSTYGNGRNVAGGTIDPTSLVIKRVGENTSDPSIGFRCVYLP